MKINEIYFNKYRVIKILHENIHNTIYLVLNIVTDNEWIIKRMKKSNNYQLDEVKLLKYLRHPNIPILVDILEDDDYIYMVREYIDGLNLDEWVKEKKTTSKRDLYKMAKSLAQVINYLHTEFVSPIIYRDLKPSNIIIDKTKQIKLIDFGIARFYAENSTNDTEFLGTKGFAAPEQYGLLQSDEKTDIYAYGLTLYYLISGKKLTQEPFDLLPMHQFRGLYDLEFLELIYQCADVKRENRPNNFEEIIQKIDDIRFLEKGDKKFFKENTLYYLGLRNGVGVSFLSFLHALEIKKIKVDKEVAIIDLSENQDLMRLIYHHPHARGKRYKIEVLGIDIYPMESIEEANIRAYDVIIVDGGIYKEEKRDKYDKSMETIVLVSGGAYWDLENLDNFILSNASKKYRLIINNSPEVVSQKLSLDYPSLNFERMPHIDQLESIGQEARRVLSYRGDLFDIRLKDKPREGQEDEGDKKKKKLLDLFIRRK